MCLWKLSHLCDVTHGSPFKDRVPYPIFHGVALSGGGKAGPGCATSPRISRFQIRHRPRGLLDVPRACVPWAHSLLCLFGEARRIAWCCWWSPEKPLPQPQPGSLEQVRWPWPRSWSHLPLPSLRRRSVPHASWVWVCKQHLQAGSCFSYLLPGF